MDLLKLVALDKDDLEVVSAHLQDAVVQVGDVRWLPGEARLVIGLNRFDWETQGGGEHLRRRTALRFERVKACKCRNMSSADHNLVLNLLAVEFNESDPPSGVVTLTFSGSAALRLEVECLECELADLGPAWTTTLCPQHPADTAETGDDSRGKG